MKRIGDMNALLMKHSLLAGAIRALNAGKELKHSPMMMMMIEHWRDGIGHVCVDLVSEFVS